MEPEDLEPVHGQGFFHITRGVIYYTIVYDYLERTREARRRVVDPDLRRDEEEYIARELQRLMDEEEIIVNGERTRCIVDSAHLEARGPRMQSAIIHTRIPYNPLPGRNVYENIYPETRAPYPYTVYWIAPPGGRIESVDSPGRIEITAEGRIAVIRVGRGVKIPGYEAVVFSLPAPKS